MVILMGDVRGSFSPNTGCTNIISLLNMSTGPSVCLSFSLKHFCLKIFHDDAVVMSSVQAWRILNVGKEYSIKSSGER